MRIIREGAVPPPVDYVGHCRHCGCVFEAAPDEVRVCPVVEGSATAAVNEPVVECPTCGLTVFLVEKL